MKQHTVTAYTLDHTEASASYLKIEVSSLVLQRRQLDTTQDLVQQLAC